MAKELEGRHALITGGGTGIGAAAAAHLGAACAKLFLKSIVPSPTGAIVFAPCGSRMSFTCHIAKRPG